MDQWGLAGIFLMLIIIAGGVFGAVRALDGIAGDLSSIREEIQSLRAETRPKEIRDNRFYGDGIV